MPSLDSGSVPEITKAERTICASKPSQSPQIDLGFMWRGECVCQHAGIERRYDRAVLWRAGIQKEHRRQTTATGHVLNDDGWLPRKMSTDKRGKRPRI